MVQSSPSLSLSKHGLTDSNFFRKGDSGSFPKRSSTWGKLRDLGSTLGSHQKRSQSASLLEVAEVRALAGDAPLKCGDSEVPRSAHEALLMRLKSRAARQEAESTKSFLALYRAGECQQDSGAASPTRTENEIRLGNLIKVTAKRVEELTRTSDKLQVEAREAELRLERASSLGVGRATEAELQAMNPFERSQRRIQEDKREEDLQRQREEVQVHYANIHRKLQSQLIELRDFKVLLREFRRLRLEKLNDTLGQVTDGLRLRSIIREMIRNGAQRLLQRLETSNLPLDPWMREVLVNCCHLEIRIEDADSNLLALRRQALKPVMGEVQAMLAQTKQERFDQLITRTFEMRISGKRVEKAQSLDFQDREDDPELDEVGVLQSAVDGGEAPGHGMQGGSPASYLGRRIVVSDHMAEEMRSAQSEIEAMKRLLEDMRHNAAAVICNQIRQIEKTGGRDASQQAINWGRQMLTLMVSEDFAKATMKELKKSAPTAKLTT